MEKHNIKDKDELIRLIEALDVVDLCKILKQLCEDENIAKLVSTMAKAKLSKVNSEEIAEEVFDSLNSIDVEDLWDNSGKTRYGYNDPGEVAFEMVENEVRPYINKMKQYNEVRMKVEEKEYCKGIIMGLLQYGDSGNNEFSEWCPDDPYTIADNIIYDWKKNHSQEDVEEIQEVYDSFFDYSDEIE